jgi:hypothetical protein
VVGGEKDDRGHNEGCSGRYVCADSGPFVQPLSGKHSTGNEEELKNYTSRGERTDSFRAFLVLFEYEMLT